MHVLGKGGCYWTYSDLCMMNILGIRGTVFLLIFCGLNTFETYEMCETHIKPFIFKFTLIRRTKCIFEKKSCNLYLVGFQDGSLIQPSDQC